MPLNEDILKQCLNDVFVETGTHLGDGVMKALKAGFGEIHSIEVSGLKYEYAFKRFKSNDNVKLYHGDSSEVLADVIRGIDGRITFYLDAHADNLNAKADYNKTPILKELDAIKHHPVKTHTIIIDDIEDFELYCMSIDEVTNILKSINKDYRIEQHQAKRMIMVAKVP